MVAANQGCCSLHQARHKQHILHSSYNVLSTTWQGLLLPAHDAALAIVTSLCDAAIALDVAGHNYRSSCMSQGTKLCSNSAGQLTCIQARPLSQHRAKLTAAVTG